jgi:hypothetical protein
VTVRGGFMPPRVCQKNLNAQLAPIAMRNAHQTGTSLRLAVSLVAQTSKKAAKYRIEFGRLRLFIE